MSPGDAECATKEHTALAPAKGVVSDGNVTTVTFPLRRCVAPAFFHE